MHVVTTKREYKGKTYETHLLQRSFREDGKVKHETLANLSHLPVAIVASIRAQLKGEKLVAAESLFTPVASVPHGHVRAVLTVIRALGIPARLIDRQPRARPDRGDDCSAHPVPGQQARDHASVAGLHARE